VAAAKSGWHICLRRVLRPISALIDGYVFEGHIPADDIKRFLQEKPADAKGLVVPKMPQGSPGMDMGEKREPYQVLLIRHDGSRQIYAQH
jgi:hypothetical protein